MKKEKAGYILVFAPNHPNSDNQGYVKQHRLIIEKRLGRYLKPDEVVHHLNEMKTDNKIENLMLFPNQAKHQSFHLKIKQFGITNTIKRQIENRWKELKT